MNTAQRFTGRTGQVLALTVTLLAVLAVWLCAIAPLLDWYTGRAETLRHDRILALRMEALVRTLPSLLEAARDKGSPQGGPQGGPTRPAALLSGQTDALAAAELQQRLDSLAAKAGLRIGSEEIMPPQPAGPFRAISVRITVSTPWRPLVALMQALAESETPMIADDLQLRAAAGNSRDPDPTIDGSLIVTAYRAGDGASS